MTEKEIVQRERERLNNKENNDRAADNIQQKEQISTQMEMEETCRSWVTFTKK